MAALVRSSDAHDDIDALAARAEALQMARRERLADVEAARADLEAFRQRYHQDVGLLHDELDRLELAIAEAELGELVSKLERVDEAAGGVEEASPAPTTSDAPRLTSDAVRALFREVAKAIHPDLADDEQTRDRRHALMVEANRAYALGDEAQLRWILDAWERSPEAVRGHDADAVRLRLVRRIATLEEQVAALDAELAEMKATPLFELKAMVDQAAARGKDLVADMVRRLRRDIMAATNRLDAMRPPQ